MQQRSTLVLAFGAALAAGFAGGLLAGSSGSGESARIDDVARRVTEIEAAAPGGKQSPDRAVPPDESSRRESAAQIASNARVLEALEANSRKLDALATAVAEAKADAARALAAAQTAASPAAPSRAADVRRLTEMSDDAIAAEIQRMESADSRGQKIDGRSALVACEILLARALTPEKRSEALAMKGIAFRVIGDRQREEEAFRESVAVAGPGTAGARMGTMQLAWTAAHHGEPGTAAETFLTAAQDPSAPAMQRSWWRYYAGNNFAAAGNPSRAREQYRSVVDEFTGSTDASAKKAAELSREALDRMDHAGGKR
jgi:hypothetical protein